MVQITVKQVISSSKTMLIDAAMVVEEIAARYDEWLADDLRELREELRNKNFSQAAKISYHIESVASTMGWPLVSGASLCLRHFLENLQGRPLPSDVERLHLGALYLFLDRNMKDWDDRGVPVLQVLQNMNPYINPLN